MKYTILDTNGLPTAFYSDDIHLDIPKGSIEITDEQWIDCLNNQGKRVFLNGNFVEYNATLSEQELKNETNNKALYYLSSTDWYVVRFLECGVIIPDEIKTNRQLARDSIV